MMREKLEEVRARTNIYYDKYRVEGPPLKKRNKLFLFIRNIRTKSSNKKLDFLKIGPFRIKKKVSTSNYKLDLPASIKLRTKVFYILLLEPAPEKAKLEI